MSSLLKNIFSHVKVLPDEGLYDLRGPALVPNEVKVVAGFERFWPSLWPKLSE